MRVRTAGCGNRRIQNNNTRSRVTKRVPRSGGARHNRRGRRARRVGFFP